MLVVADAAGTELVLKIYRAGIVPSPEAWNALQTVDSRHVTRLIDWGDAGGRVYELMEYVGGTTLGDIMENRAHYDLGTGMITEIVRQIADGLNALHGARIIHRDVKPANILVRSRSPLELALADFGLSRYVESATVFSDAGHTIAYAAPETFAGHVSPGRDWWSLGMVVRELALREAPFAGLSTEVVMLELTSRSIDCSRIADPRLRLLCRGLLARNPSARWGKAEVARWLCGDSPATPEEPVERQYERGPASTWRGHCPYRGLAAYEELDAEVFCGREQMTANLAATVTERMDRGGLLIVTGPSGAGKSSLLCAGLLAKIASGDLAPGAQDWPRVLMTPGRAPLDELAVRFASLASASIDEIRQRLTAMPGEAVGLVRQALQARTPLSAVPARMVLIVDQFEEVFTLAEENQRSAFIKILEYLARAAGSAEQLPALVILGLRADFLAQCTNYPSLVNALQSATFVVSPMTRNDIRMAIIQPAAVAGLTFEEGLVDLIAADAGSVTPLADLQQGMLPFLSQAMLETWQHRTGNTLTLGAYRAGGGVSQSIQTSAENAYSSLGDRERQTARTLLCRMIAIGADGSITRRSVRLTELTPPLADDYMAPVLETFTRSRLIVVHENEAEIVHDSLFHAWPRFRQWIEEDSARIRLHSQLAQSAKTWEESGQDPAYLYTGNRLTLALHSLDDESGLPDTSREFLRTSRRLQLRRSRFRVVAITTLIALIIISAAALIVAGRQARIAAEQEKIAARQQAASQSRQVAFESQSVSDPVLAALLAVAAYHISPTSEAAADLATAYTRESMTTICCAEGDEGEASLSANGETLAVANFGGDVQIWDVKTHRQTRITSPSDPFLTAVLSPDGQTLAATSVGDGIVSLWKVPARQRIGSLPTGDFEPIPGADSIPGSGATDMAFSPNGKILATAGPEEPVRLWDVATRRQVGTALPNSTDVNDIVFRPDGGFLAAIRMGGDILMWDTATHKELSTGMLTTPVTSQLAFSPDGMILATGDTDGVVRLWDLATGTQSGALLTGTGNTSVTFLPDVKTLLTASTDGTVRLWDVATSRQIGVPMTSGGIVDTAFSLDDRILVTVSPSSGKTTNVQVWTLPDKISPAQLSKTICARAGRNLTLAEWSHYVPGVPYQRSCPV